MRKDIRHRLRDEQLFESSPIGRRDFVRLAAATTGALTLPGAATAQIASEKMAEVYAYVINHTPTEDRVQTLIELSDMAGFEELRELDIDLRTIQEPTTAAYAQLTPPQVEKVLGIETVTRLRFAPGANPFWRLGAYNDGVFPAPTDSVDLLDFEEMIEGMEYLEEQHPDRLRFSSIGESAGLYNFITRQREPKNIWLAEITNEIADQSSYQEKEKVLIFNQDSSERQGPEAMFRFIEDLLAGDEQGIEELLDDLVVMFMINNPDGWVSKYTQYYSGERVTDEEIIRTNEYLTTTPTGADPNRSYPTPGYINPDHYPAEATGSDLEDDDPGVDDDVPEYIAETVPGELDIVEHFRSRDYENLNYVLDLHGQGSSEYFIESFPLNGDYDFGDLHDLYELQRSLGQALAETDLEEMLADEELRSLFRELNQQTAAEFDVSANELSIPSETFVYGTLFDTLGYSTSGDTISWMSAARENGGLEVKSFATEAVYSIGDFRPKLLEAWVLANTVLIRTTIEHAAEEIKATIETDGASTAYITTDALTRSSTTLPFTNGNGNSGEESDSTGHMVDRHSETVAVGDPATLQTTVPDDARELLIRLEPAAGGVELRSPANDVVRSFDPAFDRTGFSRPVEWAIPEPESGEWTVALDNAAGTADQQAAITASVLRSEDSPNPQEVLEFEQRAYEVTPFRFFEEYSPYIADNGEVRTVTIDEVRKGVLAEDGGPVYENVVVIHADDADDTEYVAALDEYVDAGGNLVLTDRGIAHLGVMDNELAGSIASEAVFEETLFTSYLGERSEGHSLLAGTVPNQSEVGKFVPLGYSIGDDAPMTLVDPGAFRRAGGSIAATTAGEYESVPDDQSARRGVAAGSITDGNAEINVIGGLLPPATQENLHPFGMNEYSISFLGMVLFTNALGYEQHLAVDGETTLTIG